MGRLVELLGNQYPPIAVYHTDTVPDGCERASTEHCAIKGYFLPATVEGRSIFGGPEDVHCGGPISGFCLSDDPRRMELAEIYSTMNHYFDTPERVTRNYLEQLPVTEVRRNYIVFEPLSKALGRGVEPEVVIFYVDPLHLSALMTVAGYARDSPDSPVEMRYALSCENMYLMPLLESRKPNPKCIIGLTEFFVRKFVDPDKFSFSIPFSLYKVMDKNAEKSFLSLGHWNEPLQKRSPA